MSDCQLCMRPMNPKVCKYCGNIAVCTKCYHSTHRFEQSHLWNVFRLEGSYTEPLPEST